MQFSDSDLLMLENLTYMDEDTKKFVKDLQNIQNYETLGDYLAVFDTTALMTLEKQKDAVVNGGDCSGEELAAILRYMKKRESFRALRIADFMTNQTNHTIAICFEIPWLISSAIIVLHGTVDRFEWRDNALGLYQTDTAAQVEALRYIEGLPYKDLTVVGHSKGGNKAQYISILSNKVQRGLSFNGQGFSKEFIDKYTPEIHKNVHKITCYNLSTDFIHPLLTPLPGITERYVYGGGDVTKLIQHHSANSFFEYYKDEKGLTQVVCTKEEVAYFPMAEESSYVFLIRNYSDYIQNIATKEDKKLMGNFIGELLFIEDDDTVTEKTRREKLLACLLHNKEIFAMLLVYTIGYIENFRLKSNEIVILLYAIGLKSLFSLIKGNPVDIKTIYNLRQEFEDIFQLLDTIEASKT